MGAIASASLTVGYLLDLAILVLSVTVDIKVLLFMRDVKRWMRDQQQQKGYQTELQQRIYDSVNEKNG